MVILQSGNAANPVIAGPTAKDLTLAPAGASAKARSAAPEAGGHMTFHELLSELNPLQYLPVIGTLFRALTGDTIPQSALDAGSMVVSGLIAGPIGVALDVGELAIEKVTGIDPEKIADRMLATIGIGQKSPVEVAAAGNPAAGVPARGAAAAQTAIAWSPAQLAAYGVTTTQTGDLVQGNVEGSDILNSLELARVRAQHAIVQYASNAASLTG
jgi:hypothetical protein